MGHSTTGPTPGSESPRNEVVLTSILILIAAAGWCMAFALGFWVRGLIDGHGGRSARPAPESAAVDRPVPSHPEDPRRLDPESAGPERLAEARAKPPFAAEPPATPPAKAAPGAAASGKAPPDRPAGPVGDRTPAPAAPERFVLREEAPRASLPFVLPEKPSFALADLKLDEPATSGPTETFCAVDRSLDTALTWARSPGAASEQARKEGKLVFLIHVSGNFEDPGFT